jgi:SAM-dependent methyltransferase
MRKQLSRTLDALPAAMRYRVRNGIALARWMTMRGDSADAYDAAFWATQDVGDWDGLAGVILQHCPVTSIIDVGCWDGRLLAALRRRNPALRLAGVDGSRPAVGRALQRGLAVKHVDLAAASNDPASEPGGDPYELAVCLETAEHLPPWRAGALVDFLARGHAVLFSAAHPNQLGTLHMNEQPFSYWERRFARAGLVCAPADAALRRDVAALDLPPWYAANVHLFVHRR